MAEITGTITISPTDGQKFGAGSSFDAEAQGTVTVPAAEGGVQDEYRTRVALAVYSEETCKERISAAVNSYPEAFEPRTYSNTATVPVSGDGGYLLTAELTSEKKKPDGSYEPKVVLDRKLASFSIGNTNCWLQVHICTKEAAGGSSSSGSLLDAGCTAPIPKPGTTVQPGNATVSCRVDYAVVGATSCTRKYKFVVKVDVAGPTIASFQAFQEAGPGLETGSIVPHHSVLLKPGDYTATVSVTVERIDSPVPECSKVRAIGSHSWSWKVAGSSSSSSSQPTSSSSA